MGFDGLVVTIGGANGERIIRISPEDFSLGAKHTSHGYPLTGGGSAVNHACRLMAMGVRTCPIVPVGDDAVGDLVSEVMERSALRGRVDCCFDYARMKVAGLTTPFSTILQVGRQRSIFNETSDSTIDTFADHCRETLSELWGPIAHPKEELALEVKAAMIGHIQSDRQAPPGRAGKITEDIIEGFTAQEVNVFANFGSAQYSQGARRWQPLLDKLSIFQLDIDEIRVFCRDIGIETLEEIIQWFGDKCTVVVTLERMGAVARLCGSKNIIIAWPYDLSPAEVADSTGAGDAFAAGIVASAIESPLTDDLSLCSALEFGRLCGAHACTTIGGADNCPTRSELECWKGEHRRFLETEIKTESEASPILRILDRVFT